MDFDPDILSTEDLVQIIEGTLGFDPSGLDRKELLQLFAAAVSEQNHQVEDANPSQSVETQQHHENKVDVDAGTSIDNLATLQNIESDFSLNEAMSESMIQDVLFSQRQKAAMDGVPTLQCLDEIAEHDSKNNKVFDEDEFQNIDSEQNETNIAPTAHEESETLTPEQENAIAMLCGITGADANLAKYFLEAAGWDIETAVALHLDGATPTPRPAPEPPQPRVVHPPPPPTSSSDSSTDIAEMMRRFSSSDVDPANFPAMIDMLRRMQQESGPSSEHMNNQFRRMHEEMRYYHGGGDEDEDYDPSSPGRIVDEYDEEGIRRPDPVRMQRLMSGNSVDYRYEMHGTIEDPSVDWMFERPDDIIFQGTLEQAREVAEQQGKWVLVNLQSHQEFMCQLLNRDTWSNESLRVVLGASFVFWQRGNTSEQGKRYMQRYKINEENLPHIAIISPQTGAKVATLGGFIEPTDLLDKLYEFLEKQPAKKPTPQTADPKDSTAADVPGSNDKNVDEQPLVAESDATEEVKKAVVDFGPVPPEPQDGDTIKISLQLASGKPLVRKYLKTDLVRSLFAVAVSLDPSNATTPFDLITRLPSKSLSTCLDMTLAECELAGGKVFHRWL